VLLLLDQRSGQPRRRAPEIDFTLARHSLAIFLGSQCRGNRSKAAAATSVNGAGALGESTRSRRVWPQRFFVVTVVSHLARP
jgi:hypothetical protein